MPPCVCLPSLCNVRCSPHNDVAILFKVLLHFTRNLELTRLIKEPHVFSHRRVSRPWRSADSASSPPTSKRKEARKDQTRTSYCLERTQQTTAIMHQGEGKAEQQMLLPTVLWAQRKNMVLLRVQIQPLEVSTRRSKWCLHM